MTTDRLIDHLHEATQSLPGTIVPDTVLAELDGWDSMGMVMFLGLLKRDGIEINLHDLRACVDVRAIEALIA